MTETYSTSVPLKLYLTSQKRKLEIFPLQSNFGPLPLKLATLEVYNTVQGEMSPTVFAEFLQFASP